jgi:nucleoside-diphosphate-sugar epimerase
MADNKDIVIVTGSSGFIGEALVAKLAGSYDVIGLDLRPPKKLPDGASFQEIDVTSDKSVQQSLQKLRKRQGGHIASVIHLAAYFDLTGEPNPKYEQITVRGTERLLRELQSFKVDQFIFASSMLAHRAGRPGDLINEDWPLDSKLPYRSSKIETERLIHAQRGQIPVVYLRAAGVYDDLCRNAFLAHQIARIYEENPKGHVYPGDLRTGQSFIHLEDLIDAVLRLVDKRKELPPELSLLLGEPEVMGYGELQPEIGRLIHGTTWETWQIPKPLAKAGSWVETDVLGEEPFIRPWMVDIADDHYALDITCARELLGWEPGHSLRGTLPKMIAALKTDPAAWYRANKLNFATVAGLGAKAREREKEFRAEQKEMKPEHMADMTAMHYGTLWTQFVVIALGAWLLTSPSQFALFDPGAAGTVRDITAERGLWEPALRNALTGWSDVASGVLLMLFGTLALSPRYAWAQWGTTIVGLWLLFAPLFLWTPSAAAYMNDTIVGALAITFSVLVPMMPGMSHEGMMDESTVPPGWTYSPSSWLQRLPIIALGFFGFLIARYLAAYQLGQIPAVWEPFFSGEGGKNGTEFIITSDVSRAWPIADAGLGATSYMIEVLMGAMGTATRWRTMPWMVTFFFILVVPLGGVSIFFIIIQPIMIGTYCTLCLIAAAAMLLMIPLTLDEVGAMGQYMLRSMRAGRPFWRTFFQGGPEPSGQTDENDSGFAAPLSSQVVAAVKGVTAPWTLIASCALGIWLMFSPAIVGTVGSIALSDHLVGALIITVAVCAMAEVARPLRFINLLFGVWLIAAPWLLAGASPGATWNDVVVGVLVIGLSLPRGWRSNEHYGAWDRYVF